MFSQLRGHDVTLLRRGQPFARSDQLFLVLHDSRLDAALA